MECSYERRFRVIETRAIAASIICSLLFTLILALSRWPRWWELIIPELSPMGWMESLLLFAVAVGGLISAMLCWLREDYRSFRLWCIFGCGFMYLSLDERLAIHERVRDSILAPAKLKIPIFFWTDYGDFILLVFLILGLLFSIRMIRLLQQRRDAFRWFLAAVGFSVFAILLDSFSFKSYNIEIQRMEQFIEEIIEISAMLSFFSVVLLMFTFYLKQMIWTKSSLNLEVIKVSSKGQITIPQEIRGKMGIAEGDFLSVELLGNELRIIKVQTAHLHPFTKDNPIFELVGKIEDIADVAEKHDLYLYKGGGNDAFGFCIVHEQ